MTGQRRRYTREMLEAAVRESLTISEVLLRLGLRLAGGNHDHIKRRLIAEGIDFSHFLGRHWQRGRPGHHTPQWRPAHEVLRRKPATARRIEASRLRAALLEIGRAYRCVICGLGGTWQAAPITLHVDHLNGLHHDDRPENLRFVCPNCHSQTLNFGSRNRAYAEVA
jgi:5-methylcytosine-specific restriction endonuclease McrA